MTQKAGLQSQACFFLSLQQKLQFFSMHASNFLAAIMLSVIWNAFLVFSRHFPSALQFCRHFLHNPVISCAFDFVCSAAQAVF